MKSKIIITCITVFLFNFSGNAQYVFTGSIENDKWNGEAYLSIVDDYRKISGIHSEQIISKTNIIDSIFEFKGNNLDIKNNIYRIHVDNCNDNEQSTNHFYGHCDNSQEIIFIANNKDTIDLPISRNNQMFCSIRSTNKKSDVFFQIDSLKELMRYDYGNFRSEANRKLNNKKWFTTFQEFGEYLNEPLADLYIYNFLSDRRGDLYSYYIKDLKSNNYYDRLLSNLQSKYANTGYANQYNMELLADKYVLTKTKMGIFSWQYLVYIMLGVSILVNFFYWNRLNKTKNNKKKNQLNQLTKQEQKILQLILQDKTNKEIASEVFISLSTVKSHINNLYKKLNLQSRDELKRLFHS